MLSFQHVINMKINDINQCENWNPECVLYYMPACSVAQSCPPLCDPMDCSPLDSFVLRIFQARILQWVAISFSRGSSRPKNWTCISCIGSTSQFGLVMFQVLSSHLWPLATVLDSTPLEKHWGNTFLLVEHESGKREREELFSYFTGNPWHLVVRNCFQDGTSSTLDWMVMFLSLSPVLSRARGFSLVFCVAFCLQGTVSFKVIKSIGLSCFLISIPSVPLRIVAGYAWSLSSQCGCWFSPDLCRGLIRENLPFCLLPSFL